MRVTQGTAIVCKHLTPGPLTPQGARHTFGEMQRPVSSRARPGLVAIALFAACAVLGISPVQSQEEASPRTHSVERGETLWELARTYFGKAQEWRFIFEANRDRIEDPNRLVPGQVLVIPELESGAAVLAVAVQPEPEEPGPAPSPVAADRGRMDMAAGGLSSPVDFPAAGGGRPGHTSQTEEALIPRDVFLSASWLEPMEEMEGGRGSIVGYSAGDARDVGRTTARPFELLRVTMPGSERTSPGDELLAYRVIGTIENVGRVAHPTGLLTVHRRDEAGVVARLSRAYDRVSLGDLVLPAPSLDLPPGARTQKASEPLPATVVGFGWSKELHQVGDIVFLDVGQEAGISLGDEFVAIGRHPEGWSGEVQGRLQVVRTSLRTSSARVLELSAPVLVRGLSVVLDRKMSASVAKERR